jgi:transglutaminase-like putative cysteine protease
MTADTSRHETAKQGEGPSWIIRAGRALRPREGWLVLILAWTAVITLPAAAIEGRMVSGLEPAAWLATLGLVAGWWLAHRSIPGWAAAICLAVAGVVADLAWGVHVLYLWPLIVQLAGWSAWAVMWLRRSQPQVPAPPVTYFAEQWVALAGFGQRVGWWTSGLLDGQGISDNLVLVGLAGLIAWGVAAWAGWWIARRGQAFVALLPTGILLAQQVYYSEQSYWSLLTFLGVTALLMVSARLGRAIETWESSGTDYSAEIRLDALLVGLAIAGLTIALAPTLPAITSGEVSRAFWDLFRDPYNKMNQRLEGSFRGVQPARSLVPATGVAAGGLPRSHLLGGRPELGQEIALRVQARGGQPGESLYWRGQTFANYNGRGWSDDEKATIKRDLAAGEPWNNNPISASRRSVLTTVEVVKASRSVLYGAGEPISADRPYQAVERAAGELIAINAPGGPRRYTVLGTVLDQDPNLLRAAGTVYPKDPAFTTLYLQLPDNLPLQLEAYAADIAKNAETPYDRAVAIEAALRELPYSLDVPVPPEGREVVSWFLFDLRKGYCDYFATAMVVLARLNGIPARLAIGYAPGEYDSHTGSYTITELQAHSWPELYFPGYGWVRFEPTPARQLPERLALAEPFPQFGRYGVPGMESSLGELRQLAATESAGSARQALQEWTVAGLCLLLALRFIVAWSRMRPGEVAVGVAKWFERLAGWGARLGRPLQAADTPREYGRVLGETAMSNAMNSRAGMEGVEESVATVRAQSGRLARIYELSLYSPESFAEPAPVSDRSRPWSSLWSALRRVWLARWRL